MSWLGNLKITFKVGLIVMSLAAQMAAHAATREIARNVQHAAQGTPEVSARICDVEQGASETGSASSQVLSAAQSLSQDSERLRVEVGKFMDSVRAA
jgi:methyl-accepting chemotaxis protein